MSNYDEIQNIQNSLSYIDPHDRDTWFRMGAAIKDELGENGFEIWDNWSRQSDNYKDAAAKAVWKSIKTGRIHIGTLFKTARENGYRPEKPFRAPTQAELDKRAEESRAKQLAAEQQTERDHAKAAKSAYGIWKNAKPAEVSGSLKHAYTTNKHLSDNVLKFIKQNEFKGERQLVIPLYDKAKLVNVQTIGENGGKSFLSGGQKRGAYTVIGLDKPNDLDSLKNLKEAIFVEGFATGASVYEATGKPVIVAFDAGNLKAVSENLKSVLPENIPIYFAADNDPSKTGLEKAQAAAEIWGERAQIMLPEFTAEHIQQYQAEFGQDKMPTDFNDLHHLSGIGAVHDTFNLALKPEIQQNDNIPQEIRTAWNDFPPVISNGKLGDLKNEPEYPAAKAGDVMQSALLVEKLLKDETIQELKKLIGNERPILVPIQSEEASGKNRIPQATAFALADKLSLQVDGDIYQNNTAKRTNSGIYHRYTSPPEFKGEVQAGKSYLIVDDTLSVGGTIAALKGYIENNGGKVIGSTVMTAYDLKVDIAIKPNMLQSLEQKQGLNEYWRNEFGYGVDKLTQQEAGHLRKPTLEQIQERIEQAKLDKRNANVSENKDLNYGTTKEDQSIETQMSGVSNLSDRAGSSGTETIRAGERKVLQSIFQQEQTEPIVNQSPQSATSHQDVADFSFKESKMDNIQEYDKPQLSQEELLKNNYWRVQNGLEPLPERNQPRPKQQVASNFRQPEIAQNTLNTMGEPKMDKEQQSQQDEPIIQTEPIQPKTPPAPDYQQDNIEPPPAPEWLSELSNEPTATFRQPEYSAEAETATSENDVAVSASVNPTQPETPESVVENAISVDDAPREMVQSAQNPTQPEHIAPTEETVQNSIELDSVSQELDEPTQPNFRQPETVPQFETTTPQPQPTVTHEQQETAHEQDDEPNQSPLEPRKAITDFAYTPPQELNERYVIADTAKVRVLNQDIGGHSLKYLSPENSQTVLMEDKGKSIHTSRSDQQTIHDMLAVAQAKNWDSIKISGSQEFKREMWLEAQSRGIATKGYKPSPEDLALLERRRQERATNSIAEAENLKQQSAVPEKDGGEQKSIPSQAVQAAENVKSSAQQDLQTVTTPQTQYQQKVGILDTAQQMKAKFYEKLGLAVLERMPSEAREKAMQHFYENQAEKIHDGKYHAPDPVRAQEQTKEQAPAKNKTSDRDDWEMER